MMEDRHKVLLAALLHDIGKFYQRTGCQFNPKFAGFDENKVGEHDLHPLWSASFVIEHLPEEIHDIVEPILYHHNPAGSSREIADLIHKADALANLGYQKIEENGSSSDLLIPALSVVLKDKVNVTHSHQLKPLRLDRDSIFPRDAAEIGEGVQEAYKNLWDQFTDEIKSVCVIKDPEPNSFINNLLALLYKYTWCIPSGPGASYVSLYDHLRITAAIAVALFDAKENDGKISFIGGDLSGIQSFIYKLSSPREAQAGMAKRLRGRSFYLSLMMLSVAHHILKQFDLPLTNLIWCCGGVFLLLVPHREGFVKELQTQLDKWLFEKYRGDLAVVLSEATVDPDEVLKGDRTAGDIFNRLFKGSQKAKYRKFNGLDEWPYPQLKESKKIAGICAVCGSDLIEEEERICSDCKLHEVIGQKIPSARYLVMSTEGRIATDRGLSIDFENLGINWALIAQEDFDVWPKNCLAYVLNHADYPWDTARADVSFHPMFIAQSVPRGKEGILTFDEMENLSEGAKFLAAIKMDVDNLGWIFTQGLEHLSLSGAATLSRMLDLYFSGYLNKIAERYKTIYILYAGGDDVFIVGAWDECIQIAREISKEFREYVCQNEKVTISGGIELFKSGFPIGRVAEICSRNLEIAKENEEERNNQVQKKNSLYLFGKAMFWDVADGVLELADRLANYISRGDGEDSLSRRFVFTMLEIYRSHFKDDGTVDLAWIPKFLYHLSRHVKYEVEEEGEKAPNSRFTNLRDCIGKYMDFAPVWAAYSLLKTRREK